MNGVNINTTFHCFVYNQELSTQQIIRKVNWMLVTLLSENSIVKYLLMNFWGDDLR